jgi:tetratricopeptide (TPR) repeat protein
MTATTNDDSPHDASTPVRLRRRRGWTALLGIILLAAAVAGYFWKPASYPEPPLPDPDGMDPAVAAAIHEARMAVRQAPRSGAAWGRLGMVLVAHEFTSEGVFCFGQAARLDPFQPRWPYYQGVALAAGKPEAAIPQFGRAAELCDTEPDTPRLRLADLLLERGRDEEAAEHFHRLVRKDPKHARAHLGLARLAYQRGELDEALRQLAYSRSDPRTRRDAAVLALEVNQRRGQNADQDQERRQLEELPKDPPWPDPFMEEVAQLRVGKQARLDRASKLLARGQVDESIRLLHDLVRDYPGADWGWYLLGKALLLRQDTAPAERALKQAAQLTPDSAEIQHYLGIALYQRQDRKAAAACFRKATQLKPDYALAYYRLGLCLADETDWSNASEAFRTAIACQPSFAEAHTALAELLVREGKLGEAIPHLQQSLEANPRDPRAKRILGELLRQFPRW